MLEWKVVYTKRAQEDSLKLKAAGLKEKTSVLLEILKINPFQTTPPYEKLIGDLKGYYSRRINIQHKLVYMVNKKLKVVKVVKMWTHYQ
jgi:Txe/YoeB family toxin of toxin-antitoxin system